MPMPKALVAQMTRMAAGEEGVLDALLFGGFEPGVEVLRRPALGGGIRRCSVAAPWRKTMALAAVADQEAFGEEIVDAFEFGVAVTGLDLEVRFSRSTPPSKSLRSRPVSVWKVGEDLLATSLLGGGGEAGDGWGWGSC
jgi:hypothetical protein